MSIGKHNILRFRTLKDIWLSWADDDGPLEGWTADCPEKDNGKIKADTMLELYDSTKDVYIYALSMQEVAEFNDEDIDMLLQQHAIEVVELII